MNTRTTSGVYQNTSNSGNVCRMCGSENLKLLDIHSEECLQNDIPNKIKLYIPVQLLECEEIPVNCCLECISTIVSWHEFVQKVVETTERLKSSHGKLEVKVISQTSHKQIDMNTSTSDVTSTDLAPRKTINLSTEMEHNKICEKVSQHEKVYTEKHRIEEEDLLYEAVIDKLEDTETNVSSPIGRNKNIIKIRRKKFEVEDKFFCENCTKGFTRKFDLRRHVKAKHPDVNFDDSFSPKKNNEILSKCRVIENGRTIFECDICKHRTNQSYNLMRHRTIHSGVKPYVCHICGRRFRLESAFRRHITQFHEGVKNYKCELCLREFGIKAARDEHMNVHFDARPFSCDVCQKSFKQKSSMYIHKLYHTDNYKYSCQLCEKKFRRSQELVHHNRLHTGHRPFVCDNCGARFRLGQDLKKHRRVHLKDKKQWGCEECQATFSQERYLKLHLKIHN